MSEIEQLKSDLQIELKSATNNDERGRYALPLALKLISELERILKNWQNHPNG